MSAKFVIGKREAVLKAIENENTDGPSSVQRIKIAPQRGRGVLRNLAGALVKRLGPQS
jgi:hypothetical protein